MSHHDGTAIAVKKGVSVGRISHNLTRMFCRVRFVRSDFQSAYEAALKLSKSAEHVKDEQPLRGRRVYCFRQTPKSYPARPQIFHRLNQLFDRTGKPVGLPDPDVIEHREDLFLASAGWAGGRDETDLSLGCNSTEINQELQLVIE